MKAEIGSPDVVMGDFIQDLIGDIEYNMQLAPPNDQYFEELSIQKFTLQQLLQEIGRHEGDSPTAVVARFVECLRRGIDAVELCWYGEEYQDQRADDLYLALYGWDCDSIVVLNPNAVIQI